VIALAVLAPLAGVAFAIVRTVRARTPALPALARAGQLDPDIEDLVRQARESVAQSPRDGNRWGRFGMVCEANGLVGAARDAYATATAIQSSEPKWWYHLASVEARLGRSDDAIRDMRRAIDRNPTYAPAFWRLGLWLLDGNQLDAAERAFKHATEIDGADRAGWIGLARVYLQRGEHARAAGLLEKLLGAGPMEPYILQLLGTAYRALGREDEAASELIVGARGEPEWADAWTAEMLEFRRGYAALLKAATAYVVAGEFQPAIRILEQLARDKPDDLILMAHLGQVYVAAGREAEGVPLLERVVARAPDRFEAYVDLATGYMHENDLDKARAAAERALSLNGSFAPAHETMGLILARRGDQRGAIAALDTAALLDPRNARALVWMGMVQTNLDRAGEALATFRRAARIDPTNADAWIGIANAQMSRHDLDDAAAALRNAQRLQPDRPAVKETAMRLQSLQAQAGRSDDSHGPSRDRRDPRHR
jgi:tetratricopeptide (TPR) repeat protein